MENNLYIRWVLGPARFVHCKRNRAAKNVLNRFTDSFKQSKISNLGITPVFNLYQDIVSKKDVS